MKKRILLLVLLLTGFSAILFAQQGSNVTVLSLQNTHVDTILKYHLAGEGVELSNGRFNNQPGIVTSNQIGTFARNNFLSFPFEMGLIMTTGACSVAAGPNSSGSASSTANVSYTDALLQQYNQGYNVMNSAALDFDFLTYADTFAFHYVFGSEEYPQFVCASYNDLFIFLLTGPDPVTGTVTTKNVAVIPGTVSAANPEGLPVSINTVNGGASSSSAPNCYSGTYSAYYISNGNGGGAPGIEYNGYTVEMAAEGIVNACDTYHMHLAICNAGDNSYDSGVFLEGKSFKSEITTKLLMRTSYCLHEPIIFEYQAENIDTVYIITPSGDTIRPPLMIESAETSDEGLYYLWVHKAIECADIWAHDSLYIEIINTFKPDLGEDQWHCTGEVVTLDSQYDDPTATLSWNTGDTVPSITIITSGEYILEVEMFNPETNTRCWSSDTVNVNFWPLPKADFESDVTSGCTPVTTHFTNLSTTTSDTLSCVWIVFDEDYNVVEYTYDADPIFHFNDAGSYTVKLVVTTADGCQDSITKWNYITTSPQPTIDFLATPETCMMSETGGVIEFSSFISDNVNGGADNHLVWYFGDGEETEEELNTSHTYTSWGDYTVTLALTTGSGCGDSVSHVIVIEDDLIFPNAITPNGDGINDVWAIGNLNTEINPEDPDEYRHNELRISDRYGKVVYHVKNYDTWAKDGQIYPGQHVFNGENLSDGVYYFTFTYKGKAKTFSWSGSITIVR